MPSDPERPGAPPPPGRVAGSEGWVPAAPAAGPGRALPAGPERAGEVAQGQGPPRAPRQSGDPDVILDVIEEDGAFLLVLRNIGPAPAHRIRCAFDRPLQGVDPDRGVDRRRLFHHLEFLPPGAAIRTLLDSAAAFLAREKDPRFEVRVTFQDDAGRVLERRIRHDLSVYRDLVSRSSPPT